MSPPLRRIKSEGDAGIVANTHVESVQNEDSMVASGSNSQSLLSGTMRTTTSRTPQSASLSFFRPGSPKPSSDWMASSDSEQKNETSTVSTSPSLTPPPAIVVHRPRSPGVNAVPPISPTTTPRVQPSPSGQSRPEQRHNQSIYRRTLNFFGHGRNGSRARRLLVDMVWNLAWGFVQIVAIITVLIVASRTESTDMPGLNEWRACDRPLGVWSGLYIIRVLMACILTYWGYIRDRNAQSQPTDPESASSPTTLRVPSDPHAPPLPNQRSRSEIRPSSNNSNNSNNSSDSQSRPPPSRRYTQLSFFSSFFSLSWFLTAHILEYTSVNTCRISSPHLWWLVFSILSITYLMIIQVLILAIVFFIVAPILILTFNIILMCLGRHPLQNPGMIRPEIGKLPKAVVDRIPLVMYIPPPPDAAPDIPIKVPDNVHAYPPKSPQQSATPVSPHRRRFRFLRRSKRKEAASADDTPASPNPPSGKKIARGSNWEDNFETDGYPFVVLEGNRAACAICLMDFEEPKRIANENETPVQPPESESKNENVSTPPKQGDITQEPRLEDAGEGAQPLRLLECGHVFHKTCLDPWLTEVSGRCPVCQKAVTVAGSNNKRRN